jgi:hypothetical protein
LRLVRTQFSKRVRDPLHENVARFLGDAFVYFNDRDRHAKIISILENDLQEGAKVRDATGEPLIVLAHSMGGNVVYDLLTGFRPDLHVDFFVTVGSQVAVIEELKLYRISDKSIPNATVSHVVKPTNIGTWFNVFDHSDVLGFAVGKVFADTQDFEFNTKASLFGAHTSYFNRTSFFHRLGARVRGVYA